MRLDRIPILSTFGRALPADIETIVLVPFEHSTDFLCFCLVVMDVLLVLPPVSSIGFTPHPATWRVTTHGSLRATGFRIPNVGISNPD